MLAFTNSLEKNSPTIIGAGCTLVGDIKTDHIVQIHGIVQGNISAETVVIASFLSFLFASLHSRLVLPVIFMVLYDSVPDILAALNILAVLLIFPPTIPMSPPAWPMQSGMIKTHAELQSVAQGRVL